MKYSVRNSEAVERSIKRLRDGKFATMRLSEMTVIANALGELQAKLDKTTGWVPVSERLPHTMREKDPHQQIIVTDGQRVWATTTHSDWWAGDTEEGLSCVTHWVHMPGPPRRNKNAG